MISLEPFIVSYFSFLMKGKDTRSDMNTIIPITYYIYDEHLINIFNFRFFLFLCRHLQAKEWKK